MIPTFNQFPLDKNGIYYSSARGPLEIETLPRETGYNIIRPHSSLRYKPPAPETLAPFLNTPLTGTSKMIGRLTLRVVQ